MIRTQESRKKSVSEEEEQGSAFVISIRKISEIALNGNEELTVRSIFISELTFSVSTLLMV